MRKRLGLGAAPSRNPREIAGAVAHPALVCGLHARQAVSLDDELREQLRRLESEIGALCEVRDEVTRALQEEQLRDLQNVRVATLARLLQLRD